MPMPVSSMSRRSHSLSWRARTVTLPPSRLYFHGVADQVAEDQVEIAGRQQNRGQVVLELTAAGEVLRGEALGLAGERRFHGRPHVEQFSGCNDGACSLRESDRVVVDQLHQVVDAHLRPVEHGEVGVDAVAQRLLRRHFLSDRGPRPNGI